MSEDGNPTPIALAMLRREHVALKNLFRCYFASMSERHQLRLLRALFRDIQLHYATEASVLIPACARVLGDPSILDRAGIDYAVVMMLIEEIERSATFGVRLEAKIIELRRRVFAHIDAADGPAGLFELVRRFDLGWEVIEKDLAAQRRALGRRFGSPES
jgi:hypothetical protein